MTPSDWKFQVYHNIAIYEAQILFYAYSNN